MNIVCLTGSVCRKEELKVINNGKVVNGSLAVSREYQNIDGKYEADFINLVFFNQTAEYFNERVSVGDIIEVNGRWQTRSYETENGKRIKNECVVSGFRVIRKRDAVKTEDEEVAETAEAVNEAEVKDDDLPF